MARWRRSERERAAHSHPIGLERRREIWAACSALLDYPSEELVGSLAPLRELAGGHPGLTRLLDHLAGGELRALQEEYVDTFDHTRRCALYLTYFAYGDTRRRGVALVQFKQAYRRAGVEFDDDVSGGELPDHLCAVLQFGAFTDPDAAWGLLIDHRAGVEMLRLALTDQGSPWAGALTALCETLPELQGDETDAVRRLIEEGPPAEEVGLQPYATDPLIAGANIPVGAPQ